jgi:hypothetical protein
MAVPPPDDQQVVNGPPGVNDAQREFTRAVQDLTRQLALQQPPAQRAAANDNNRAAALAEVNAQKN